MTPRRAARKDRNHGEIAEALPCGCLPGRYLCPEAERLWAETGRIYSLEMRARRRGDTDMANRMLREYEAASRAYREHMGETL